MVQKQGKTVTKKKSLRNLDVRGLIVAGMEGCKLLQILIHVLLL